MMLGKFQKGEVFYYVGFDPMSNNFFSRFMPKETKFFPLLDGLANSLVSASDMLVHCISSDTFEESLVWAKKIKEEENKDDQLLEQVYEGLHTTFITPFDREDIHELAEQLEEVSDGINGCGKKLTLYYPKRIV
jgi:uncharacterized protein Yka (UPF0111/DUF47 family)